MFDYDYVCLHTYLCELKPMLASLSSKCLYYLKAIFSLQYMLLSHQNNVIFIFLINFFYHSNSWTTILTLTDHTITYTVCDEWILHVVCIGPIPSATWFPGLHRPRTIYGAAIRFSGYILISF